MWRGSGERVGKSKSERACMIKSAGKVRGKRGGEGKTWRGRLEWENGKECGGGRELKYGSVNGRKDEEKGNKYNK